MNSEEKLAHITDLKRQRLKRWRENRSIKILGEVPQPLKEQVKEILTRRGITLREFIEEAVRNCK